MTKKYEIIYDLEKYIEKNYSGAELVEEKSLNLDNFIQSEFEVKIRNCSLVSMTRMIKYHIPYMTKEEIFREVLSIARKNGFSERFGTVPFNISKILREYFKNYGIRVKARGKYLSNFYNPLKSEIDGDRPLLMNIGFGKYKRHTVSIIGYKIFRYKNMNIKFIELLNGWTRRRTYIDYNVFKYASIGICSYNTLKIEGDI